MRQKSGIAYIADLFRGSNRTTTINLIIRGLTLAGKFFFVILLARQLTEKQMGEWGIFSTSISLSLYLIGLDFYTYSSRTLLEYPMADRGHFLRDQMVFYLISYAILFPLLSVLFFVDAIEWKLIFFFYIILVFEHLAQESYRTFVLFGKPITANVVLFLRTGLWTMAIIILWIMGNDELRTLKSVLMFWMGGGAAALIVTIVMLSRFHFNSVKGIPIDWKWLRKGIQVSLIYFIATICFKAIEFADRYFIDYYHTREDVGVYTLYANLSNMIEIFVHTTTIIIFSPKLIYAFHRNNYMYRKTHAKFSKNLFLFNLAGAAILAIMIYPILKYIVQKEAYLENISAFILLCVAEMVFNISLIFHYILYVRKNDFSIVKATIIAACTNIALNFILIPAYDLNGAALATIAGYAVLVLMKAYYARHTSEGRQIIFLQFLRKKKPKAENGA
ncbi:MAG: polysaccharide biosynthesis C-terminal domain-containing protein [Chitinophagales bacterium]